VLGETEISKRRATFGQNDDDVFRFIEYRFQVQVIIEDAGHPTLENAIDARNDLLYVPVPESGCSAPY
jgi:hypothetical protein